MERYRRIIADQFMDQRAPRMDRRLVRIASANASGDRPGLSVVPGTALIIGPDLLPTQDKWTPASSQIVHGSAARTFAVAGANQSGGIYIANVNTLAGRGMYHHWAFTDAVEAVFWDQGRALNVAIPAGVNVTKGMGLTTNAVGWFVPATSGQRVIMSAEESFNNTTGVYQHVRVLPVSGA